jgi:hypothetical protein
LTPFCNKSLNGRENTKELNCGLDLPRSFTNRVIRLNKVCNIPKERTMRRGTCKKLETKEGRKNWINTFMEGPSELVSGRKLTIAHSSEFGSYSFLNMI